MIESHVTSLALSQRLAKLGVNQESLYFHAERKTGGWNVQDWHWVTTDSLYEGDYERYRNPVSAFLASELGELLPVRIQTGKRKNLPFKYYCNFDIGNKIHHQTNADTMCDAMGLMLEYLLKQGLLTLS